MTTNRQTLTKSIPVLARLMSGDGAYKVVIQGDKAYTNEDTMVIPALGDDVDQEKAMVLIRGYYDHEVGHKKFSDFFSRESFESDLHFKICNILEDPREEACMGKRYPGSKKNLDNLQTTLIGEGAPPVDIKNPPAVFVNYMLSALRTHVLGQEAHASFVTPLATALEQCYSRGFRIKLDALMYQIEDATCTADAVHLSKRIYTMLQDEQKAQEQQQQDAEAGASSDQVNDQGQGQDQSCGQGQGQGKSKGKGQKKDGQDDAGNQDASPPDGNPADGSGDSSSNPSTLGNGKGHGTTTDKAMTPEQLQNLKDLTQASLGDLPMDTAEQVTALLEELAGESQAEFKWELPPLVDVPPGEVNHYRNEARAAANALQNRLKRLLESSKDEDIFPSRSGSRLIPSRLAGVTMGNYRVYERTDDAPFVNTSIHLLLDVSGSMKECLHQAVTACVALADALDHIDGTTTAITTFPHHGDNAVGKVKSADESLRQSIRRFGGVRANGSTPMANAMFHGITDLVIREEPRKILVVITDGDPNGNDRPAIAELTQRSIQNGIEVVGIGINTMTVEDLFPSHIVINDIRELAGSMLKLLDNRFSYRMAS